MCSRGDSYPATPFAASAASVGAGPTTLPLSGDAFDKRVRESVTSIAGDDYGGMTIDTEQDDGDRVASLERFLEADFALRVAWCESNSRAVPFGDEENPFLLWIRFLIHISDNDGSKQPLTVR